MSRALPFVKASACGNDFILIDGTLADKSELKSITQRICDRHSGVGADGVEWLYPTDKADIYAHLINSDGSDAEVSGNGTRCVAAWYVMQHQTKSPEDLDELRVELGKDSSPTVRVLTDAGVKVCTLVRRLDKDFEFRSDMGEPQVDDEVAVKLGQGDRRGVRLSMGNPQFVYFVGEFGSNWQREAAEIEGHSDFPQRTNVELVKVKSPHELEIRIYERGAGETQSSGTGSCAAAVAAIYTSRTQSPVRVVSPGGSQTVEWDGRVFLTGPARILCRGEFFL